MIKVDQIERIRKMVLVEGLSERAAAKAAGVSRYTVRRALNDSVQRKYTLTKPKARPVQSLVESLVHEMLRDDDIAPKKQRHTARRIYHRLIEEHSYTGSEATIRRMVAAHKQRTPEVFVPLEYDPGAEAQVDFGEAEVFLGGLATKVHLFCMKLAYSRQPFVMAFATQRQEAFFEGHIHAFAFFGGIPRRLTYDNLKAAVQKVLEGHEREEQLAFTALRAHYLFDSHFCTPRRGNEKGQVESLVGYVRRNVLVPRPEVGSLDELNAKLRAWCERESKRTVSGLNEPIHIRFELERSHLLPLPSRPFDPARQIPVKVSRYAQVTYETNTYSVPWRYVGQVVTLKVYAGRIEVWANQQQVACHARCYAQNESVLVLDHYLEIFLSKPGALQYAIPFKQAMLPPEYRAFHAALQRQSPRRADRQFVELLLLHRRYGEGVVRQAVAEAMERQSPSFETVQLLLQMHEAGEPVPSLTPDVRARLPELNLPSVSTTHFNRLLGKGGEVH
jgi:transposase